MEPVTSSALAVVVASAVPAEIVPEESVPQPSCPSLLDVENMSVEELNNVLVRDNAALNYYMRCAVEMKKRFAEAPRDTRKRLKEPICGCFAWQDYCKNVFHRSQQAVDKTIRPFSQPRLPAPKQAKPEERRTALKCARGLLSEVRITANRIAFAREVLIKEYGDNLSSIASTPSVRKIQNELEILVRNAQRVLSALSDTQ